jgi:CheY-like chemotaxis protein
VLFVEDEEVLRDLVRKVLAQRGYRVLTAGDGAAALAEVERHAAPVDLVLTDVIMPQMSGPALVAQLRARHPGLRVLYVSGYTADALREQAESGTAFLAKPFAPEALLRKVREVLDAPREPRKPPVP